MEVLAVRLGLLVVSWAWLAGACSTHGRWREMPVEERLYRSQVVVVGKDVAHVTVDTVQGSRRTDMLFQVECVLKNTRGGVPRNITVVRIAPRECSGTLVRAGTRYILSIKRTGNLNFEFHEVNTLQSAAVAASPENVRVATQVCGLTEPQLPYENRDGGDGPFEVTPVCPDIDREPLTQCTTGRATLLAGCVWLVAIAGMLTGLPLVGS